MYKIFSLMLLVLALSFTAIAQDDDKKEAKPNDTDKHAAIPSDSYMKRGAPLGDSKKVSLAKVMKNPAKYAGKTVRVEGVITRSCTAEGCWAELAPKADGKGVRVKMKDHAFFIPLKSAGATAKAEGVFSVKTLTKEHVDHLAEEGAKFGDRNPDGSVTEISFEAFGMELKKATK